MSLLTPTQLRQFRRRRAELAKLLKDTREAPIDSGFDQRAHVLAFRWYGGVTGALLIAAAALLVGAALFEVVRPGSAVFVTTQHGELHRLPSNQISNERPYANE